MRNSITSRGSAESRAGRCVFVAAVLFALLPATGARATTLLSVTGAGGDTTGTVLSLYGSALALSFELVGPQIGLDIEVPLTCLQCEARFYLVQNEVGPTSNFVANVRAITTVSTLAGGGFINRMTTLFTDLTLAAGDYFLVFAPTRDTVSGAIWTATQQPVVVSAGALHLADLRTTGAAFDVSTPPLSIFSAYEVNAVPTWLGIAIHVPEPGAFVLVSLALLGWACLRARRSRRTD